MGTGPTYFEVAENDYMFYEFSAKHNQFGNAFCAAAQNLCERYLKHLIDTYCSADIDTTKVLRAHALRTLSVFIQSNILDFTCDWDSVLKADGYYYNVRYPGDNFYITSEAEALACWAAVNEIRNAVINFIAERERQECEETE